ncbi:MAG: efflux RND transporter periplasmic adaptor subunit [Proteobacteria bacterium]|nr:efflux RND transporter periplasmic adaptor subunit [Pseudomonadota bacterium]
MILFASVLGSNFSQVFADAGHSHGEAPAKQAVISNSSAEARLMKTGKTFEIVFKITDTEKPELTAYITAPESNLPISNATVTVNSNGGAAIVLNKTDKKGVYSEHSKNIENGTLSISIKKEKFEEKFTFENVNFSASKSGNYLILILVFLSAIILFLLRKKLKFPKWNCSGLLLIALLFKLSHVFAHGDEVHGSKKKKEEPEHTKTGDTTISKSSSGLAVPKELQLHLNITTEKVVERSLGQTLRLIGHVVSDPSGYARLQASQNARVLNDPEYPLPLPGQKVKKDQVVLSLQPTLGKTETSDQKTALYKIESDIVKLRKDVERKEKLGEYGTKKDLENARIELESVVKQKEEIINKTFKPEYLRSPLDGIVADLHVRPGEIVTSDKTIVEIVDPSTLMVEALLFDSTLSDEIVKGYARLPLNADKTITLELLGVSPKVNKEDQAIHLLFKAKETDASIKLDMAIEVIAELKSSKPTLAIPKGAIVEDRTGVWVFVKINPETFEPRKVRVNRYIDGYAEITDGVNLGEVIVVDGAYLLNQAR